MIKIFHTADLHIGMRFKGYPDNIKGLLQQARLDTLDKMIQLANENGANLFVIAGDIFDRINGIDKKSIVSAAQSLDKFNGECVIVMPGNHDYDNGMVDLWEIFNKNASDKVLFVNEEKPYSLVEYGIEAMIYPAPCHTKHSSTNNIGWIKHVTLDENLINIGIAHGSLQGLSPDMDNTYYNMSIEELQSLGLDLCLLGHTHIVYPLQDEVTGERVFNPGTPEPDGLDCKHNGNAWFIETEKEKNSAKRVETGKYRFIDRSYIIRESNDLNVVSNDILSGKTNNTIARISLRGRVEEDVFSSRIDLYKSLEKELSLLIVEDDDLGIRITADRIHQEFSEGSFPQKFLLSLSEDEEALQLAYELIMEVKR